MIDRANTERDIDEEVVARLVSELRADQRVLGAIWVGSRSRGEGIGESSDIDMIAIIDEASGLKRRRGFRDEASGRHVELLFRAPSLDRLRFRECAASGESWPHGYATGRVLFDRDGTLGALVAEAGALWAAGPAPFSQGDREWERYESWLQRADIADRVTDEPAVASHLIAAIFERLLRLSYRLERRWYPPAKYALRDLAAHDPPLAAIFRRVHADGATAVARFAAIDDLFELLATRHAIQFDAPYRSGGE